MVKIIGTARSEKENIQENVNEGLSKGRELDTHPVQIR